MIRYCGKMYSGRLFTIQRITLLGWVGLRGLVDGCKRAACAFTSFKFHYRSNILEIVTL